MKVTLELLVFLMIVLLCIVVSISILLQHLWPIALMAFVAWLVYRRLEHKKV